MASADLIFFRHLPYLKDIQMNNFLNIPGASSSDDIISDGYRVYHVQRISRCIISERCPGK